MTGPTRGTPPRANAGEEILLGLGRTVWAFRVELGILGILASAWAVGTWLLLERPGPHALPDALDSPAFGDAAQPAAVMIAALAVAALMFRPTRRGLGGVLARASTRRRLLRALTRIDLPVLRDRIVRVVKITRTAAGWRARLLLPPGAAADDLDKAAERIAVAMRLRLVTVTRDRHDAALIEVRLDVRDPLAGPPLPWAWQDFPATELRRPVPVAIDEHGELVSIELTERNLLLGGEPGAGKSNALQALTAAAALDPTVRLHLFDGKLVELATWAPLADTVIGPDPRAAAEALTGLRQIMDSRYRDLLARGQRKISAGDGLPLHVVVIDELALFVNTGDKKLDGEIANQLRDLVSRGRAAGVIVLAATQKPSADVIPSHIRDLFSTRWAMRCATPQASDTILGQGWAIAGYSAANIDAAQRGVGYLLAEGDTPTRCRAFYLSDTDLTALAARATGIRAKAPGHGPVGPTQTEDSGTDL